MQKMVAAECCWLLNFSITFYRSIQFLKCGRIVSFLTFVKYVTTELLVPHKTSTEYEIEV